MAYIGQTLTEGTRRAQTYTATAGQTSFNAVYSIGNVDVYQNGILLQPADYTATTGTTVVLGAAAALNDEITIYLTTYSALLMHLHYQAVARLQAALELHCLIQHRTQLRQRCFRLMIRLWVQTQQYLAHTMLVVMDL